MSFLDAYSERSSALGDQDLDGASSCYGDVVGSKSIQRSAIIPMNAVAKHPNGETETSRKISRVMRAAGMAPQYSIFSGKGIASNPESERKQLRIGNTVYDTLVNGISSIRTQEDFRGIIKIKYNEGDENYYMVFALWYSKIGRSYYLTSLGQYSDRSYRNDLKRYNQTGVSRKSLHITLSQICRRGLANLKEKLMETNITRASVCLMQETISTAEISDS